MSEIYVICGDSPSHILTNMITRVCGSFHETIFLKKEDLTDYLYLQNKKLLFACEIDFTGSDIFILEFFKKLYSSKDFNVMKGSSAIILVHSSCEFGTKDMAQNLVFLANNLGCSFMGQPLVEATASLSNFKTWQKTLNLTLEEVCYSLCDKLGKRFYDFEEKTYENPKCTVLYSTPHKVSNTLDLWHMVSSNLEGLEINEIHIENGEILDCIGCSYTTCLHYAKQNRCFYGGIMVREVLPSIEESDLIIWLCPNYNDSLSANITALINRLTVLYKKISLFDKAIFAVVVSGNSGSDSVAKQLIGALNINKGFKLPPHALLTATANDAGAIFTVEGIEQKAQDFGLNILDYCRNLKI